MMAKSIDVIFYLKSFKVVDVLEVIDYDADMDKFLYNRLFEYRIRHEDYNGNIEGEFVKRFDIGERLGDIFMRRGLI
ncbi:MAG TPA: hypothetical protein GX527_10485 [Clostridiaceae bacterium]|jgi:pilus assembly protein CpaF|nr:hypothetical protein [Clostridiaceae bacterium]